MILTRGPSRDVAGTRLHSSEDWRWFYSVHLWLPAGPRVTEREVEAWLQEATGSEHLCDCRNARGACTSSAQSRTGGGPT